MRERQIRYSTGASTRQYVMPVPEGISDEAADDIARQLTGLLYEREVTPWRHVPMRPKGQTA